MIQTLNKGEIWLANLNPNKGTEPGKTRPVLIIQNQGLLDVQHPSTIIIPLTTQLIDDSEPLRIRITAIEKLEKDSDLILDQVRAIDNKRLVSGPLARLDEEQLKRVFNALFQVMGGF